MTSRVSSFKRFAASGYRKETIPLKRSTNGSPSRLPAGTIIAYAGSLSPEGWLLCDGSEKLVSDYSALDAIVGPNFGRTNGLGGAGSSHFRLPDLRGRVPVGTGTGAGLTARTIAATGGTETHTLTGPESGFQTHGGAGSGLPHTVSESTHGTSSGHHTLASSSHTHDYRYAFVFSDGTGTNTNQVGGSNAGWFSTGPLSTPAWSVGTSTVGLKDSNNVANQTNSVTAANASSSHSNVQPSLVANYIIKT